MLYMISSKTMMSSRYDSRKAFVCLSFDRLRINTLSEVEGCFMGTQASRSHDGYGRFLFNRVNP